MKMNEKGKLIVLPHPYKHLPRGCGHPRVGTDGHAGVGFLSTMPTCLALQAALLLGAIKRQKYPES